MDTICLSNVLSVTRFPALVETRVKIAQNCVDRCLTRTSLWGSVLQSRRRTKRRLEPKHEGKDLAHVEDDHFGQSMISMRTGCRSNRQQMSAWQTHNANPSATNGPIAPCCSQRRSPPSVYFPLICTPALYAHQRKFGKWDGHGHSALAAVVKPESLPQTEEEGDGFLESENGASSLTSSPSPSPSSSLSSSNSESVEDSEGTTGVTTSSTELSGDGGSIGKLSSLIVVATWIGFVAYAFFFSPNQTPRRDIYFLEKLLHIGVNDGVAMNPLFEAVFNLAGLLPSIYALILIPSGRSDGRRVPIWPFLALAFFTGSFALLPYFALWTPPSPSSTWTIIPTQEEREGIFFRVAESKVTPFLLFGVLGLILSGVVRDGGSSLEDYWHIFQEGRFVHMTTIDVALLMTMFPFWVWNDMMFRNWPGKDRWGIPLSLIPIIGPLVYLIFRPPLPPPPIATTSSDDASSSFTLID